MSKVSIVLEFANEQEAMAFLASRGAPMGMAAAAPAVAATPAYNPAPPPPPPPASPPPAAYTPPPAMAAAPAPAGAGAYPLPPGVMLQPVSDNGQPWTPTTIMPLMQAYGATHRTEGVAKVFARYGFPPNIMALNAEQLAVVASHLKSNQPA